MSATNLVNSGAAAEATPAQSLDVAKIAHQVEKVSDETIEDIETDPARSIRKRIMDVVMASVMLAFFSPLMGIIYLLVKRDGGPAIFVQDRVGKDGVLFPCYKFRTMAPNAEELLETLLVCNEQFRKDWAAERKLRSDPRITPLGAFLRRKSFDEFPQLINVIRGDMSLVGPRPITPDEVEKYGDNIRYYLRTRPGLTGAWQVSGRNDVSYEKRVELDVEYTSRWSWSGDFSILFKTLGAVLNERGAL
jgi:lipopolysaccharide/colanic/teichoic acid biosynthesis glycosyltransferase